MKSVSYFPTTTSSPHLNRPRKNPSHQRSRTSFPSIRYIVYLHLYSFIKKEEDPLNNKEATECKRKLKDSSSVRWHSFICLKTLYLYSSVAESNGSYTYFHTYIQIYSTFPVYQPVLQLYSLVPNIIHTYNILLVALVCVWKLSLLCLFSKSYENCLMWGSYRTKKNVDREE